MPRVLSSDLFSVAMSIAFSGHGHYHPPGKKRIVYVMFATPQRRITPHPWIYLTSHHTGHRQQILALLMLWRYGRYIYL